MSDPNSDLHETPFPDDDGSNSAVRFADESENAAEGIHDGDPEKGEADANSMAFLRNEQEDETTQESNDADEPENAEDIHDGGDSERADAESGPMAFLNNNQHDENEQEAFETEAIHAEDASDPLGDETGSPSEGDSGVPLFEPVDDGGFSTLSESDEPVDLSPSTTPEMSLAPDAASPSPAKTPAAVQAEEEAPPAKQTPPLVKFLFTWASIMTLLVIWLLKNWPEEPSPLDTLPDDGIKTSKNIISPLERLSSRELFRLGESKRVGDLEITPVAVEFRPIELIDESRRDRTDPVLVLRLKLKNVSERHAFHPTDPVYYYPDRRNKLQGHKQFNRRGYTYTFVHPEGKFDKLIFCFNLGYDIGMYFEGQTFPRLEPGQSAEVVVVSEEVDLKDLSNAMVWRVKLRKGKTSGGKGVATVIGVQFQKNEIQTST